MRSRRVVARVVAGLVVALVPAGCTDDSTSGDASASSTSAPDTSATTSTTSTSEPGFDEFTGSIDEGDLLPAVSRCDFVGGELHERGKGTALRRPNMVLKHLRFAGQGRFQPGLADLICFR